MATEPNPMLGLCKAQMLALLEAHRHWVEDLLCLRQVQLRTDEGLLEADRTFGAELASAPDFNAVLNSQLAFINRQLAMQHRIWQGWMQIGARGPAVWAEQYQGAQMAWQHVFSDSAATTSSNCSSGGSTTNASGPAASSRRPTRRSTGGSSSRSTTTSSWSSSTKVTRSA